MENAIKLSAFEKQSGRTRVQEAEQLILQLPAHHDGRNTWLLNYGTGPEAQAKREAWNRPPHKPAGWDDETQSFQTVGE